MGRAIDYPAPVPEDVPEEARGPRRSRFVPGFWWALRDVYSEIKAEIRLIVG